MFAILGATGKVGRATIHALLRQGHRVRAIVRDAARAAELAAAGCELAVADLRDRGSLARAFEGAAAAQVISPVLARAPDAFAAMTAMNEALAAGLADAGTPAILAISDYGAQHASGTGVTLVFHDLEKRLARLDASLTFLRSAEHMQNWARHLTYAADSGTLPSMHLPSTKPFPTVSAGDVGVIAADLLVDVAGPGSPRIVHVEGPRRYTAHDVAAAISAAFERDVAARELPRAEWLAALQRGGLSESYARLVVELYDIHNAGGIDVEAGVGELRRGTSELGEVLAGLARPTIKRSSHA